MSAPDDFNSANHPHGVQLLHDVSAAEYPPAGGAFIWSTNGLGKLRWCTEENAHSRRGVPYDQFLMLGDVPLVQWQIEAEHNSPTCLQLLQAGDTPPDELEPFAAAINAIRNDTSITNCIEPIAPVVQLLSSGLYFIAFIDYVPTNGEDRFFWRAFGELRVSGPLMYHIPYTATGEIKSWEVTTRPMFLAPTQSTAKFAEERFESARMTYNESPGLAYYLGGRLSALLDGHHRATCAAMNGVRFRALTIADAQMRAQRPNEPSLHAPGICVPFEKLSQQSRHRLFPPGTSGYRVCDTKHINVAKCHAVLQRVVWPPLPKHITSVMNTAIYPTDAQCSLMEQFQDRDFRITDETIESTLQGNCDHLDECWLLENLLNALCTAQDPRLVQTAIRVAQSPGWRVIWETAYQLLSTIRSEEVENQFVQFLVDDDGSRPEIKAIVDRYFESPG